MGEVETGGLVSETGLLQGGWSSVEEQAGLGARSAGTELWPRVGSRLLLQKSHRHQPSPQSSAPSHSIPGRSEGDSVTLLCNGAGQGQGDMTQEHGSTLSWSHPGVPVLARGSGGRKCSQASPKHLSWAQLSWLPRQHRLPGAIDRHPGVTSRILCIPATKQLGGEPWAWVSFI